MKHILPLLTVLSLTTLTACVSPRDAHAASEGSPTIEAPSGDKSRLFDCFGKNQGKDGVTRPDCLPNDGDAAARATEDGAGTPPIHP